MRSDEYAGGSQVTRPTNDGCKPVNGQDIIKCGVNTTLMDCCRGSLIDINLSNLSDYFVWDKLSTSKIALVFTFNQPVNIHRISMWFWNAVNAAIRIPNVTLLWSNDDSTTPSNLVNIDISNSPTQRENRRYRLNVDITDEGLMIQSLKIVMNISEGQFVFLNEVFFCGKCISSAHANKTRKFTLQVAMHGC